MTVLVQGTTKAFVGFQIKTPISMEISFKGAGTMELKAREPTTT